MHPRGPFAYLGEILLATTLCLGLFILICMAAPIATNLMAGGSDLFSRRVVFDTEGIPRFEFREMTYSVRSRSRKVTWYDLDMNKIGEYPDHRAPRLRLGGMVDLDVVQRTNWRGGRHADLTAWRYLPPPGAEVPIWFRLPYRGQLVGYTYPYGRLIGYLGPRGFSESGATGPGFDHPRYIDSVGPLGHIWVDGDTIYSIDLDSLKVRRLWTSPSGPIRALGFVRNMGVVLSGNILRVIDLSLQTQFEGPLPPDLRKSVAWQMAWLDDGRLVIANVAEGNVVVYHLSPTGEPLHRWSLEVPSSPSLSRTRIVALTVASSIMSPWLGAALQKTFEHWFPDTHRMIRRWVDWPYRPTFFAISITITLISTLLTWLHLRRRCMAFEMSLGLIVTLIFSWPGHLVCRSLFEVADRVPCPTCGKRRTTDRMKCFHCGAGWHKPPVTGGEILLPAPEA